MLWASVPLVGFYCSQIMFRRFFPIVVLVLCLTDDSDLRILVNRPFDSTREIFASPSEIPKSRNLLLVHDISFR